MGEMSFIYLITKPHRSLYAKTMYLSFSIMKDIFWSKNFNLRTVICWQVLTSWPSTGDTAASQARWQHTHSHSEYCSWCSPSSTSPTSILRSVLPTRQHQQMWQLREAFKIDFFKGFPQEILIFWILFYFFM